MNAFEARAILADYLDRLIELPSGHIPLPQASDVEALLVLLLTRVGHDGWPEAEK